MITHNHVNPNSGQTRPTCTGWLIDHTVNGYVAPLSASIVVCLQPSPAHGTGPAFKRNSPGWPLDSNPDIKYITAQQKEELVMAHDTKTSALVDPATGLARRRIFIDQDLYEEELQSVFGRCWLYLAHEDQIAEPGDFVTAYMGEDHVIVIRATNGDIHAFLNTCRHRGKRVCQADCGNAASFTCTYHGWVYGNDGRLLGVPREVDLYRSTLEKKDWGLVPVPRVESYKGLIFGNLDADAVGLPEYLGSMALSLDYIADRREGGIEIVPGVHKFMVGTNWKLCAENFAGDNYHTEPTHLSVLTSGFFGPSAALGDQFPLSLRHANGHGSMLFMPGVITAPMPELRAYEEQILEEAQRRVGPQLLTKGLPLVGNVFPNFSFVGPPLSSIRVWHPRGPGKTETWSWVFVDKNAPAEIKELTRLHSIRNASVSGVVEPDDLENWNQCFAASKTPAASRLDFNYQLGLGRETYDDELSAWVTIDSSEGNQRGFYDEWSRRVDV